MLFKKKDFSVFMLMLLALGSLNLKAQQVAGNAQLSDMALAPLSQLQQKFVDLNFGMFIHFNIPTYVNQDWPDPGASPSIFNPIKLDCDQWAEAAKSAHMTYGCLTTKHHSGFLYLGYQNDRL